MDEDTRLYLAREAYDAFCASTDGIGADGRHAPAWPDLHPAAQEAWIAAAARVAQHMMRDLHTLSVQEGSWQVYKWIAADPRRVAARHGSYSTLEDARKVAAYLTSDGWGAAVR